MKRRDLLAAAAVLGSGTRSARADAVTTVRFIPVVGLAILDPIANTSAPTRTHGNLVFDTLYGLDANYAPQPQMVEGHQIDDDGRTWTLRLRDGLRFHDGEAVLGRDVIASIRRWAQRDSFGGTLMAATDELTAPADDVVRFRLRKPFPLLPYALGKTCSFTPVIMPERLAKTSPSTPVTEMVGSGPFRFEAGEYVPGARTVYSKFKEYVPRRDGVPGLGSGPKVAHVDRVEWTVVPDPATAMAAMQSGQMDWWEAALPDLLPPLQRDRRLRLIDASGSVEFLRFNCLFPPFDKPAIRRLVLSCFDQTDMMRAVGGAGRWRDNLGVYVPGPMENDAGMDAFRKRTDWDQVKRDLAEAGYGGEPVVMLVGSDSPANEAASQVGAELFKQMGFKVDYQSLDWGTVAQRRTSMQPPDKGGWNCFFVGGDSDYFLDPANNFFNRGNGKQAWYGWPTSARLEELYAAWFDAPDLAAQQKIAREIQLQTWQDVPYIPCGLALPQGVVQQGLTDILPGVPKFYNLKKA